MIILIRLKHYFIGIILKSLKHCFIACIALWSILMVVSKRSMRVSTKSSWKIVWWIYEWNILGEFPHHQIHIYFRFCHNRVDVLRSVLAIVFIDRSAQIKLQRSQKLRFRYQHKLNFCCSCPFRANQTVSKSQQLRFRYQLKLLMHSVLNIMDLRRWGFERRKKSGDE